MKKRVWNFIFAVILASMAVQSVSACQLVVVESARIRTAPNTSSPFTDVAKSGDTLPFLGKSDDWYRTRYNGNDGWVASSLVRIVSGDNERCGSANLFTRQDLSILPPAAEEGGPAVQKYGRLKSNTKILQELDPQSPFVVMGRRSDIFPIAGQGDTWCLVRVESKDTTGWVRCDNLEIFDEMPTSPKLFEDAKLVFFILLAAGIIVLIVLGFVTYKHIKAERQRNIFVRKNALILAKETKMVQFVLTNANTPVERCFSEIGFNVSITKDSVTARQSIEHSQPDIVLVDWNFEPSIFVKIENLFSRLSSTSTITYFLFYNVPDPSQAPASSVLKNVSFLGPTISDRDIFKIVTPLIVNNDQEGKNVQASVQRCALQGEISGGNLLEVLQFIEIGCKTGCLMVEAKGPFGLVYFNNGKIVYAAAGTKWQGADAVYAILNQPTGKFRFVLNKHPKNANLNLSTLSVLMEWTKEKDEAAKR
ncbi:MAG: DUF4388 domain-containing protein [Chitinispirillia bacterium]|nr:DUF4388 domain-containing protein [Chitinispirillia bacterium]